MAVDQALESVRNHKIGAVPNHLRDAHYKGAAKLGHGSDINMRMIIQIIM